MDHHAEARRLYWERKDLASARKALEEGITLALASQEDRRGEAKAMCYDLASFCWPGWDEPGIAITEDDIMAGEKAAERNLELALELKRGHGPMGNAHFMVGAYQLHRGRLSDAEASFGRQKEHAAAASNEEGELLADGYIAIAENDRASLDRVVQALRVKGTDDALEFADQLLTAARIYLR